MEAATLLWILAVVLVVAGFAGLILPALPGPPLIFLGLLAAAWAEDFQYVGLWTLALLAVLTVVAYFIDFAATAFGAKRFGATPRAGLGAAIGLLVGMFFGLPGIVVGPFLGAVIGELSVRRSFEEASRAGLGATLGMAVGAAIKIALAFIMLGAFISARLFTTSG
jgi:uncharacterized protein YqgC (DUF456 family)